MPSQIHHQTQSNTNTMVIDSSNNSVSNTRRKRQGSNPREELDPTHETDEKQGASRRRTGRYLSRGQDRHPPLSNMSAILMLPRYRPGRIRTRRQMDAQATQSFGDVVVYKDPGSLRLFFQNVKGLTYSSGLEDYKYYLSQMAAFGVDCFGLAETNTAWQHYHLQLGYKECVTRQFRIGKTVFGYPI
jgi:hypothetical protein